MAKLLDTTTALLSTAIIGTLALGCMDGGGGGGGGGGGSTTMGFANGPNALQAVSCPSPPAGSTVNVSGTNVLAIGVGNNTYCSTNQPCVSVTVCQPGSATNCQTISDILVDTGSFGLRIFESAVTSFSPSLFTQLTDGSGNPIAECAEFGSANTWGPIVAADVYLGGEPALSSLPIQLLNSSFETIPSGSPCASSVASGPNGATTFNGILGVGFQPTDDFGTYYRCVAGSCSRYSPGSTQYVPNPVTKLSTDNNGVIIDMPQVANDQQTAAVGALILGIGTGSHSGNNTASGVTAYEASPMGYFTTTLEGYPLSDSFIDSGSNLFFFPGTGLGECSDGFFCLQQTECFQATVSGYSGNPSSVITFKILGEAEYTGDNATDAIGADATAYGSDVSFDWGLPFFYGRKVFVVISGKSAPGLGTGPIWAF